MANGAMKIRERPKWTWIEVVKKDMPVLHLNKMTLNKAELEQKHSCIQPQNFGTMLCW